MNKPACPPLHFGRRARSRFGKGREERLINFSVLITEIANFNIREKCRNSIEKYCIINFKNLCSLFLNKKNECEMNKTSTQQKIKAIENSLHKDH